MHATKPSKAIANARLPLLLIIVFAGFLLFPRAQRSSHVVHAFLAVSGAMTVWWAVLVALARRRGSPLLVEFVPPIRQHYIQACVQICLYAYWGWYWRPIYDQAPLILAQLFFLFAFDGLFAWSRGRVWRVASGPAPIVLSTNLFIWFVDDWFVLQFGMLIAGLLGKEFLKWNKEGRRTHIFNPSGFGLLVTAIVLITTGTTDELTLARPLAQTIDGPPQVFLVLFCLGLVVQHFFSVTLMTLAAAATIVLANQAYLGATGVYLFGSTNLPAAGFLGLHLLMTDPSTSPRTNLGRLLFGAGYGLGYMLMYDFLGSHGHLELYAKLFPVPILNLTVRALDHIGRSGWTGRVNQIWETAIAPRRMNALHMAIWAAVFVPLFLTGYFTPPHPGSSLLFWKRAFLEERPRAGYKLALVATGVVQRDPGGVYNELGVLSTDERFGRANPELQRPVAEWFALSLKTGSVHAARNLLLLAAFSDERVTPQLTTQALVKLQQATALAPNADDSFLLGLASEFGVGGPVDAGAAARHYRACGPDHALAAKGLARLAMNWPTIAIDPSVIATLERSAAGHDTESMWYLAHVHAKGRGVPADEAKARSWLEQAATKGLPQATAALQQKSLPAFAALERARMAKPSWSTAFPL